MQSFIRTFSDQRTSNIARIDIAARIASVALFLVVVCFAGVRTAQAQQYTLIDLGTLGGRWTAPLAINSQGDITGFSQSDVPNPDYGVVANAFIYRAGSIQNLGSLGGRGSFGYGINNSGWVAGSTSISSPFTNHAFLYHDGLMTDLGTLGGTYSEAKGINALGQVVGSSSISGSTPYHAFLYSNGVMQDLGTLGGLDSVAEDINDRGQIAGAFTVGLSASGSSFRHAFLYDSGIIRDIGSLGGTEANSYGVALNANGHVVGETDIDTATGISHAFLYRDGGITDLGTLGGLVSGASGINLADQVVGYSNLIGGLNTHAFLYQNGAMSDLNTLIHPASPSLPFVSLTGAQGINDNGWVVAIGVDSRLGTERGYLLIPDADGDGIADNLDLCPNTAQGALPNASGCSPAQQDADHDGVIDSADGCPGTAIGVPVNAAGCSAAQRDSDADGVADSIDACPGTPAKTAVNAVGCPVVKSARQCDADRDADIDWLDIRLIVSSIGAKPSGTSDPRDANKNGRIDLNDAAMCAAKCDLWLCQAK